MKEKEMRLLLMWDRRFNRGHPHFKERGMGMNKSQLSYRARV